MVRLREDELEEAEESGKKESEGRLEALGEELDQLEQMLCSKGRQEVCSNFGFVTTGISLFLKDSIRIRILKKSKKVGR